MYGLTKEDITKAVVVASLATATAFCLYKGWKIGRRLYEDHKEVEELEEKREAVERIIAETKKATWKQHEPDEYDLAEDETEEPTTIKTISDIDEIIANTDSPEIYIHHPVSNEEMKDYVSASINNDHTENYVEPKKTSDVDYTDITDSSSKLMTVDEMNEKIPGIAMSEEDRKLKYDKDSIEAWNQYVDVSLVGIPKDSETRIVMERLYDHEVILTDGDDTVESNILDMRIDFFGEDSKWVDSELTLGEIIKFFAGKLDYDLGPEYGGTVNWLYNLTSRLGLDSDNTNEEDFMEEFADEIVDHTFSRYDAGRDEQLHGIFGLTESEMTPVDDENGEKFMQEYWDFLNICQ